MPHQCVRCGKIYEDGARQLLYGCDDCSGKFFFFIKKEAMLNKADDIRKVLSKNEISEMEKDVREIAGSAIDENQPVILDIETIKTKTPGKYEIDVVNLMRGKPVIISIDEGKYFIDLPTAFESAKKENK